jgi:mercuric ion binding protein
MKRTVLTTMLFLAALLPALAKEITTQTIKLPTVQCDMCKSTIESKMKGMKGLKAITVNVEELTAEVKYDADVVTLDKIEKAIADIGYDANDVKASRRAQRKLDKCCQPGAHK